MATATHNSPYLGSSPTILIIAGEASGDRHGARLVAEIRQMLPEAHFLGIGGEALAAQGVELLARAEDLAVVGLTEVTARLPAVIGALREVNRVLRQQRPALTILIDFPDFNFLVARLAKWRSVRVMYYISPQVWAWRRHRVRTIARYVDRMVVIFPFEEDFYTQHGVKVTFVGHPLMETLPDLPDRRTLLTDWGLDPDRFTLALLPGSRGSEIERHLPVMLAAAQLVREALPEVQFLLPLASTAPRGLVEGMVGKFLEGGPREGGLYDSGLSPPPPPEETVARASSPGQPRNSGAQASSLCTQARCLGSRKKEQGGELEGRAGDLQSPGLPCKIIQGRSYEALAAAHLAVVASGTVTVEAALAGTPTIIIYRLAPLTFQVAKLLIRVDHIGMANLLAGEGLFPELIQEECTPERLAREVLEWVRKPKRVEHLRPGLARVAEGLGPPGVSRRAAEVAVDVIKSQRKAG